MLNKLLSQIKCTRTYLRKSDMTSGNAYRVTLTHRDEKCQFIFNDNFKNESSKLDFLSCLILDAQSYEMCKDVYSFAREFGYEDPKQARKAYYECQKQSERLHRLFNDEEIKILSEFELLY